MRVVTHSVVVASSGLVLLLCSADSGTIESWRAGVPWLLLTTAVPLESSSHTKNCGGDTKRESLRYSGLGDCGSVCARACVWIPALALHERQYRCQASVWWCCLLHPVGCSGPPRLPLLAHPPLWWERRRCWPSPASSRSSSCARPFSPGSQRAAAWITGGGYAGASGGDLESARV